jgi:hypothetical protein
MSRIAKFRVSSSPAILFNRLAMADMAEIVLIGKSKRLNVRMLET